jgi:hypothetical protein
MVRSISTRRRFEQLKVMVDALLEKVVCDALRDDYRRSAAPMARPGACVIIRNTAHRARLLVVGMDDVSRSCGVGLVVDAAGAFGRHRLLSTRARNTTSCLRSRSRSLAERSRAQRWAPRRGTATAQRSCLHGSSRGQMDWSSRTIAQECNEWALPVSQSSRRWDFALQQSRPT